MAYSIRSLADLSTQARGFFTQSVAGAIASIWPNTFTVVAKVLALLNFEHEQRRRWLFKQMFVSSADEVWLARHGFELNVPIVAAAPASGSVTVSASAGMVVPSGLVFTRADGATYTTLTTETASGSTISLVLDADVPAGNGNTDAGATMTLANPDAAPVGLGTTGTVDAPGLTGGTDAETTEAYRARVLARKRRVAQGGSRADYRGWVAESLATVRDVYVDSFVNDISSVWICFTVTDQPNGIPTAGQIATVQAYLSDPDRRPVTARPSVFAPSSQAVDIAIANLTPDTPDIRAAIAVELAAVFIDRAAPATPSTPFKLWRSWLDEAISRATGEDAHDLVLPAADIVYSTGGQMPVLGAISYS